MNNGKREPGAIHSGNDFEWIPTALPAVAAGLVKCFMFLLFFICCYSSETGVLAVQHRIKESFF